MLPKDFDPDLFKGPTPPMHPHYRCMLVSLFRTQWRSRPKGSWGRWRASSAGVIWGAMHGLYK